MSVFPTKAAEAEAASGSQSPDPRLTPTPDYGTLGPGSDFAKGNAGTLSAPAGGGSTRPNLRRNARALSILAMLGGMIAAIFSIIIPRVGSPKRINGEFGARKRSVSPAKSSAGDLERQKPQKQAELLLARAVSRDAGATGQIQEHVDGWRGKITWTSQLSDLTTVALNSNDMSVRESGVEVQLAAYGLAKRASTVDRLILQADSSDHAQKIWALWSLGLLGNRGIESDRVVDVLSAHAAGSQRDSDEDSRHWAVEALALVGTTATIPPLLDAMHNDPSAMVRERAACSLAESGMLTHEQRMTAVPQLINYSGDSALDAQTQAWAFKALHDITNQALPNDSAAWREWYQSSAAGGH